MFNWQLLYLLEVVATTNYEEKNIQSKDEEGTQKIYTLSEILKPLDWALPIGAFVACPLSQVVKITDHLFNSCYCSKGIPIKSR